MIRLRHPLLLAFSIVLVGVLWVAFVATGNPHEMLVGAVTSAATILFGFFVCRSSETSLELRAGDLLQCWRIPWYVVSGIWEIALVLFKDLVRLEPAKNLFRVCGFDSSEHDPRRAARAVLAVSYTTVAPNFIVLGVDASQSRMLFHQLAASPVPKMTRALGAKA